MAPAPAVARLYWGADTAGRVPLPGPSLHSTCTCAQPALLATRLRPGTAALLRHGAPLQLPCSPLSAGPSIPPRCTAADSEPGCTSARYSLCPGSPFALDASARPAWSDSAGRRPSPRGACARSRPETERLATPQLFSGHPRWQVAFLSALGFSFVVLAREWRPEFWERLSSPHTLRKRSWGGRGAECDDALGLEIVSHAAGQGKELATRRLLRGEPRPQARLPLVLYNTVGFWSSVLPKVLCWNTKQVRPASRIMKNKYLLLLIHPVYGIISIQVG